MIERIAIGTVVFFSLLFLLLVSLVPATQSKAEAEPKWEQCWVTKAPRGQIEVCQRYVREKR